MPKISLYIHIPFCDVRCGYCSFVSDIYCRDTISAYLCHLKREADLNARYVPENISLKSIFFGGGTPSALSEAEIVKLFGSIYDRFNRDIGTEISFEANPESLTESKIRLLKQLGINRLSIGIQSFDEGILAYLGRVHSYQDAKAAFDSAKDADFDNVSIDLIYGIPYQTLDNWRHDIEEAVRLNPEHISIYCLSLEPEALLYKETPRNWPNDDLHSEMYYWARGALLDAG
ncbi:MAG: radical SAM family heme chaperone HemW, partial [bacterium]|nr:radical SAM family heme chaperone HemW [bacterium]